MEQLEKAMIVAHWRNGAEMELIPVQFNPTELQLDKSAQIAEISIPGLDSPLLQFVRGQNEKVTVDFFFDTTEEGMGSNATSVTTHTDRIYELIKIEPETHAPPVCAFVWNARFPGSDTSSHIGNQMRNDFQCIIENVKQKFTLFSPEGVPLRATLSVTMREYKSLDEQLHQLNLTSPNRTHSHTIQQGETLSYVAARYFRTIREWRRVADENNIEDPRRLSAGLTLTVPSIK